MSKTFQFTAEITKLSIEATEAELAAAQHQINYLKDKLASLSANMNSINAASEEAETSLDKVLSGVLQRLKVEDKLGSYRAAVSPDGSVISLQKIEV